MNNTFVDTSGFYALLVKKDKMHVKAKKLLEKASKQKDRFVTTDYILDEAATLLRARGYNQIISHLYESVFVSRACSIEWMDPDRFQKTRDYFTKHSDHSWSFTDCFSFVLMKELGISQSLTKDSHFREAGFVPILV